MVKLVLADYSGAIEDFTKVLNVSPNNVKALFNRGTAYSKKKEYKKAIVDFDKALSIDPKYYKALINRGICKTQLDQTESAKNDFSTAVSSSPTNGEGYYYRALATLNHVNLVKSDARNAMNMRAIKKNILAQKEACSDFEKAKVYEYAKAYEAIKEYCVGVK